MLFLLNFFYYFLLFLLNFSTMLFLLNFFLLFLLNFFIIFIELFNNVIFIELFLLFVLNFSTCCGYTWVTTKRLCTAGMLLGISILVFNLALYDEYRI